MKQHGIRPLINFYNRLEKDNAYHTIAGLLLQNITRVPNMMIQEVADTCFTSEATISRLAKKAGYEGFNDLREQATKDCSNYFTENRIVDPKQLVGKSGLTEYLDSMIALLKQMRDSIDDEMIGEAVSMIHEADHIYYFGTVDSFNRMEQDLFMDGKFVDIFQTLPQSQQMRDWNEHMLAVVDNPGYPWFHCNHVVSACKQAGAKVLMLSCTSNAEVEQLADYTIALPGTKSGRDETLFNMLMNILAVEYRRRYMDAWYYK